MFLRRKMERRQKRMEEGKKRDEADDEEWPPMPHGYRILTSEEKERQMREESRQTESAEMLETPLVTEMLQDMQMAGGMMSSFPSDPIEETVMTEPILTVFDDTMDSPLACPIVVDTVPDDDGLLFTD